MFRNALIFDDSFWETVEFIDSLEEDISIKAVEGLLDISEFELYRVISILENFNYNIKMTVKHDDVIISPPDAKVKMQMDFTLPQWVLLQAHIPSVGDLADENLKVNSFHDTLVMKMVEVEQRYPQYALDNILESEEKKQEVLKKTLKSKAPCMVDLNTALCGKYLVLLELQESKLIEIFPQRLVYIDGMLSIIAEMTESKCLNTINVNDIKSLKLIKQHDYHGNFSTRAIDDFIYAIRAVNGNEVRLILKIFNENIVDINPPFHFQGNTYITTNASGDTIWASSVEISDQLFEWLLEIRDGAEILDPDGLKKNFLKYCHKKLQKDGKAS